MKTIIIGRKGNQPFLINQDGVSKEHAKIEIDDKGHWWLEDLDSLNGTFIREDNGEMESLGKRERIEISEMTFICLGPCNSKGCNFYAKQVVSPENFKREFEYLNDKKDEFNSRLEEIEKKDWNMNLWKIILPTILFGLSFLITNDTTSKLLWMIRMSCSAIPTALIHLLYNPKKQKKAIESEKKRFFICPNPQCSHILNSIEIEDYKCSKCKNITKLNNIHN